MAAKLHEYGSLNDIDEIKCFLFEDCQLEGSWFDHVGYSMNACGDTLSILHHTKLVIVRITNHDNANDITFDIIHKGYIPCEGDDQATCLTTLSIALQQKSVGATTIIRTSTWNCIAVGFSSGYLKFFTDSGAQLFEQIFHPQPISNIKYCHPKALQDELLLIYPDIIVAIDGFSLHQCLKFCRLQLLRNTSIQNTENLNISYKKWYLQDQISTSDVEFYGVRNTSPFEHLFQASLAGGSAHYIGAAGLGPVFNYLAVGKCPFIAQYCPSENAAQPIMSEVVMNVASKLISYIPGSSWLSGWVKPEEPRHKFEPPQGINKAVCIDDPRRECVSVSASPGGNLAIISDNFGRLLLVDVNSMIIINIWKGYRGAQCGWLQVSEGQSYMSEKQRSTIFLVIYAKKRGIVEVWCPFQHYRVGAFNVGKRSVLVSNNFHALGEGCLTSPLTIPKSRPGKSCCFLLSDDGSIKFLNVPFENCLGEEYMLSISDKKVLKEIKTQLVSFNINKQGVLTEMIFNLQLAQNVTTVLKEVYFMEGVTTEYKGEISSKILNELNSSKDLKDNDKYVTLEQTCHFFLKILSLYRTLFAFWNRLTRLKSSNKSHILVDLYSTLENYFSKVPVEAELHEISFLTFYEHLIPEITSNGTKLTISTNSEQSLNVLHYVCSILIHSADWIEIIDELLEKGMELTDVFTMFIQTCLQLDIQLTSQEYEEKISLVAKEFVARFRDFDSIWCILFEILRSSENTCQAFIIAVYMQKVAVDKLQFTEVTFETQYPEDPDIKSEEQEWVALSPEHEKWYTLRQQLWDAFVLTMNTTTKCTVNNLLHSNNQTVTHIVANRLIQLNLVQNFIDWVERCKKIGDGEEGEEEEEEIHDDSLNWLLNIIPYWPYQLDPTVISICLVECLIIRWSASLEENFNGGEPKSDVDSLLTACNIILSLKSVKVIQSLVYVLWETVFSAKLKAIFAMVEKVGRQPKDRICLKETDLSLNCIMRFISVARYLLLNVTISSDDNNDDLNIAQENVWVSENRQWLLQKCFSSNLSINKKLLLLHAQLLSCLELVVSLNVKNFRPTDLFHPQVHQNFFIPITTTSNVSFVVTPEITKLRIQMLKGAVKQSVNSDLNVVKPYKTTWFNLIDSLASFWGCLVEIQSYMGIMLYTLGHYDAANDILLTSPYKTEVSIDLLRVLLAQFELIIFQNEESQKFYLPLLTPSLTAWLKSWHDPTVVALDLSIVLKMFSGILNTVPQERYDSFIQNCSELKTSLGKILL